MRVDYQKVFPGGVRAMGELERAVHSATLEPELLELVRVRASQINGCTCCLAMHNRDARARGGPDPAGHGRGLATVLQWPGAGRASLVRGADRAPPRRGLRSDVLSLGGLDLPGNAAAAGSA
jgi:AhpD family alkylhydroperoxidase